MLKLKSYFIVSQIHKANWSMITRYLAQMLEQHWISTKMG